ncbi:unnamed protein product [Phytophthora fragariaefolia]|uniref:Unnamed protein product n=1 Tax=Phytophthora fragariaefolia TaxID=1490495 RepID=A0A9W6YQV3_9STRA|nr:unnamed protein product [Phytophthora fragariaefolia]
MKFDKKLAQVPIKDRAVERRAATVARVFRHLVQQAVKEGMLKRRTIFIKPALTAGNKLRSVEHTLSFIDRRTLGFEPMHNIVRVDDKCFYSDRDKRSYLVLDGEEPLLSWFHYGRKWRNHGVRLAGDRGAVGAQQIPAGGLGRSLTSWLDYT